MRRLMGRRGCLATGALAALAASAAPAQGATTGSGAPSTTPPKLSHVSVSTGLRGEGATFLFSLNEPALVTLRFARRAGGRTVTGRCVAQTAKNRGKPKCSRSLTVLRLRTDGHPGPNRFVLPARTLRPGSYTVALSVRDACGHVSSHKTLRFTATI